jgi:hypothetical protein
MARWQRSWIALAAAIAVVAAILLALGQYLSVYAHNQLIQALRQRYQSDVEVRSIRVSLLPPFRATLEELKFRHHGRTDVPPLIAIRRASASVGIIGLLRSPKFVRELTLEGLEIHVPPRADGRSGDDRAGSRPDREPRSPLVIESIVADGTILRVLPRKPGKQPLEFDIRRLRLKSVGIDRPMEFDAQLRNAKPPGMIRSHGRFGPWAVREPGDTAVSGDYTFEDADLSAFRGIAGILSSQGSYKGKLERIEVQGATDTPDFMVRVSGHSVHLKTEFSATVDGTDGDTYLHPVTAHFLRSTVVANGSVASAPGVKGKTVDLDATVQRGRVEDMLRLAVKSDEPALTGSISFRSKIVIPPGDVDIVDKLYLNGTFGLASGRFTSRDTQNKVATLSRRAQGDTGEGEGESVASKFTGAFALRNGSIHFPRLQFVIPGAVISLAGDYDIRGRDIDLRGEAQMEATVSEMTTGVKSFLLKLLDPLFKRKDTRAGAVVPIHIHGKRDQPSVGLDVGKVLK